MLFFCCHGGPEGVSMLELISDWELQSTCIEREALFTKGSGSGGGIGHGQWEVERGGGERCG